LTLRRSRRNIKFRGALSEAATVFICGLFLRHLVSSFRFVDVVVMAVAAIIPARYGSTRLPGKPLALIDGKPMIQHVYESASKARILDRVLVATDDQRIVDAVKKFGGEAIMTSSLHASGTDRIAEVARRLKHEWIVNVQGDLPFIQAATISRAVQPLRRNHAIPMGTVCNAIYDEDEWRNPNIVKVLMDRAGLALSFTRSPVPYVRNANVALTGNDNGKPARRIWGFRHLGLYVYRREFLFKFARLRPTALEQIESLEQLRAMEYGYRIHVARVDEHSVEVDTAEDLKRAAQYLNNAAN
jgi:3-deoxy-manno-octulosonate cytidylyltransferase (CMP-KDO synthetase)